MAEQSNGDAIEAGPSEEGQRQRARFNGHIELTDVRIAPPSANLQRTRLINATGTGVQTLVAATIEMSSMRGRWWMVKGPVRRGLS